MVNASAPANLAVLYNGVNLRAGPTLSDTVLQMTKALTYADVIDVTRKLDAQNRYWTRLRLSDNTQAFARADVVRIIGDFRAFDLGTFDTLDWAEARMEDLYAAPIALPPIAAATGLVKCPVLPAYNSNDYGTNGHDGVDLADAAGASIKPGIRSVIIRAMRSTHGEQSVLEAGLKINNPQVLNDAGWGYGLGNHVIARINFADLPEVTRKTLSAAQMVRKFVYVAFGHMKNFADGLTVGAWIDANTIIGQRGHSGNADGDHVHLWAALGDVEQPTNPFVQALRINPHWLYDLPDYKKSY